MSVPDAAPPPNWSDRLKNALHARRHQHGDIMWVVRRGCQEIMELHKGRQTEAFYEKMLACYLYERGIPYMTQVWSVVLLKGVKVGFFPPPKIVCLHR